MKSNQVLLSTGKVYSTRGDNHQKYRLDFHCSLLESHDLQSRRQPVWESGEGPLAGK